MAFCLVPPIDPPTSKLSRETRGRSRCVDEYVWCIPLSLASCNTPNLAATTAETKKKSLRVKPFLEGGKIDTAICCIQAALEKREVENRSKLFEVDVLDLPVSDIGGGFEEVMEMLGV